MTADPSHIAYPATEPPPLKLYNEFDTEADTEVAEAVRIIAEILQDDEWHDTHEVLDELDYELDFTAKGARKLIMYLKSHGDVRSNDQGQLRITTRWRCYPNEHREPDPLCTGCSVVLTRCKPLWPKRAKCCPDCSHS